MRGNTMGSFNGIPMNLFLRTVHLYIWITIGYINKNKIKNNDFSEVVGCEIKTSFPISKIDQSQGSLLNSGMVGCNWSKNKMGRAVIQPWCAARNSGSQNGWKSKLRADGRAIAIALAGLNGLGRLVTLA